ncbi:MAG: amidohydrolase family protein, partial [Planctomycetia bacterium]
MNGSRGTMLRARHVLPAAGRPLENGWIRIQAGRVVAVGAGSPGPRAIDLGDAVLVPGLVNAHTHLEFSGLERPFAVAGGMAAWIGRVVGWRRERDAAGDAEATRAAAIHAGCRECAVQGVTTVGEIATGPLPAAVGRQRLRVFREVIGLSAAAVAAAPRGLSRDLDRLSARGIAPGISPHAPYTVAAPLAARLVREIVRRRLPVAMHLAESLEERELLAAGTGPFRRLLEDLGAWDPAVPPRLLSVA